MAEISGVELASVYLSLVPSLRGAEKAIADQIAAVPMARPAAALGGSLARGIGTGLRKSAEIGVAITSISTRMGASIASTLAADAGRKIGRVLQSSGIMQPIQQRMAKINEFITKRAASARDSFLGGVVRTAGKVPTSLMAMMADAQSAMGRGWQKLTAGAGAAFSGITQRIAGVGNAAAGAIARGAGAAVAAAGRLGSQMAAAITSSVKVGTAAIAGLVAANVDRAIDRVDVMTTFPKAMQNLGYSAEDSAAAINKISAGLNGLPTATNDLAGFVKRIVPTTSGLDEAAEVGLAFNNMLLAGGGALQEQSSAMEQFAQMLAVGKVDMVGFRAVMQAAPGQLDQLAASMLGAGAKGMDLYDAMMAGTITISDFNQALVKASREGGEGFTAFADQAKNASGGIRTAMGRMNTAVARGIAKVIEAIGPERIGNAFAAVGGAIEKVLTGIASLINGSGSGPGMAGLLPIGGAILGVLGGMASQLPFIGALFQGITGPVGLVVGLLGAMFVKSQPLRDALSGVGEAFGAVFATLGPAMRWILKTFEALAVELAGPLADAITTAGEPLAHLFGTTFRTVVATIGQVATALGPVIGQVFGVFGQAIADFAPHAERIVGAIGPAIVDIFENGVGPAIESILPALTRAADMFGGVFADVIETVAEVASDLGGTVLPALGTAFARIVDAASPLIRDIVWLGQELVSVIIPPLGEIVADLLPVLADLFAEVAAAIGPLIIAIGEMIGDLAFALMPIIKDLISRVLPRVIDAVKRILPAIQNVIGVVLEAAEQVLPTLVDVFGTVATVVLDVADKALPVIIPVVEFLVRAFGKLVEVISTVVIPSVKFLWESVIKPVFEGIGASASWLFGAVSSAWNGIKSGVSAVADWFTVTLPQKFHEAVNAVAGWFTYLRQKASEIWQGIKDAVKGVIDWFANAAVGAWRSAVGAVESVWNGLQAAGSFIWGGIRATIDGVSSWFSGTIKPAFDKVTGGIRSAFEFMRDGIKAAWDGIKRAAAAPVNFVIDTVYNNGIKKGFDWIADAVGLDVRLPALQRIGGYASGGVLPGYTPGRDVHHFVSRTGGHLHLSGGEAIMVPEWTRAVGGPRAVAAMNAAARRGRSRLSSHGDAGRTAFADGGVWGWAKDGWDWIKDKAKMVWDVMTDPIGAVVNLIQKPAENLLAGMGIPGMWADLIAGTPGRLWDGFKDLISNFVFGEGGNGSGAAAINLARTRLGAPYVWGATGPDEFDCSGLVVWVLRQLGRDLPRFTASQLQQHSVSVSNPAPGDLYFWGGAPGSGGAHHVAFASGPGRIIEAATFGVPLRETGVYGGAHAGRLLYDQGGYLMPGISVVENRTGSPEPVFSSAQWDKIARSRDGGGMNIDRVDVRIDAHEVREFQDVVDLFNRGLRRRIREEVGV